MSSIDEHARAETILALLERRGRVTVTDLTDQLSVSAVTIRKDLEGLEQRSLLRRIRGGAVSVTTADEGSFELRLRQASVTKKSIARAAAAVVRDGDVIAMDASTTCYFLAEELLDRRDLMVVTNGLRSAMLFLENSSATVLMPGGVLRRSAGSMVGPIGDVLAGRGQIDKGFFGVKGISVTHGLLDHAIEEAEAKKYLTKACAAVYGLFDSGKVGRFGLHSFVPTRHITALYTDDRIPAAEAENWFRAGVPVHTVPRADQPVHG